MWIDNCVIFSKMFQRRTLFFFLFEAVLLEKIVPSRFLTNVSKDSTNFNSYIFLDISG